MALGFIRCNEINPAIKIEFTGRLCYNKNKTNYITARKAINMAIKKKLVQVMYYFNCLMQIRQNVAEINMYHKNNLTLLLTLINTIYLFGIL